MEEKMEKAILVLVKLPKQRADEFQNNEIGRAHV